MESANVDVILSEAVDHMGKYKLQEAQAAFNQILTVFNENNSEDATSNLSMETFETVNQCLVGLADVHLKFGYNQRQNAFTWFHHYLCSIAYLRESLHLCHKNETNAEGWRNCDVTNKRLRIEERLDDVTGMFNRHLRHHMVNKDNAKDSSVNEQWLENFVTYICDSFTAKESPRSSSPVKSDLSKAEKIHKKRKETKERKMDFNKIQKAISKLVRNITADIRSRYRRKKLSEETLRRSVSCEILSIMSPITDDNELVDLFERVIAEDEGELTSPSAELDVELSQSRSSSKRGSTDSLLDDDGALFMSPRSGAKHGANSRVTSPTEGPNDVISGASTPMQTEGSNARDSEPSEPSTSQPLETSIDVDPKPDFTVWKSYIKSPRPNSLPFKQYRLKSFEEMSPLTETSPEQIVKDVESHKSTVSALSVHPLSAVKLNETLGHMMSQLASILADDQELDGATELYKYSLGLIHQCAKSSTNTTLIAKILKNLGILKCKKGDLVAGCQLLQEAMQLFKAVSSEDDLSVASVWCELGRAFLMEREHVTSLFNHVMQEVRSEMDVEWREEVLELGSEDDSEDSSSTGDSYAVHVHEALECMQSALSVLDKLNPREEHHGQLLVEVLTKLGDCNVVIGDYTKAVGFYEEVLSICKNVTGSTTFENNAHVLLMLGVANFLLGNHPKAVTMLETASILQKHIFNEKVSFEVSFTFTMLGSVFYKMGQYHRCIVWCLRACEPSITLGDRIEALDFNRSWFIVQTFFTLGYAYFTLDFFDKAICYLEIGQHMLERCCKTDTKQYVKLLKVLADCHVGQENYECALQLYEDATQLASTLGDERSSTALQNQLLNCMAAIQVNTRQYSSAAKYLEQALDHQRTVETSIKGDLISLQYKLGVTYTLSGEIDKAVDCFEECLETLSEAPGSPGQEAVHALGKLANLYHVKGLMQDENDYMNELLDIANTHFTKAMNMDHHSSVCVQYANFLTQQGQSADALHILLPFLFGSKIKTDKEVNYSGVEQAILPEHLQHEADDMDTVTLETKVLAYFLGILCFKELKLVKDADDCLEAMYKLVLKSDCYFSFALMGYAFMEMAMYEEAAECFAKASQIQQDNALPAINCCLCLYLNTYQVITKALKHIVEYYVPTNYIRFQSSRPAAIKPSCPAVTQLTRTVSESKPLENRDSGYFEHDKVPSLSSSPNCSAISTSANCSGLSSLAEKHYSTTEASFISSHESDSSYLTDQSMMSDDRGYNSNDSLQRIDNSRHQQEDAEIWETIDSKGNVISSTIYEVEDNGNYQTDSTTATTSTSHTTDTTTATRHNDEYNDNYRRLYESVQTALNERWVNTDLLDNDTLEKLRDAGFVPPPQSPHKSVSSYEESPKRKFIDNVSNRYSNNTSYMHTPGGKEEMSLQIETDYPHQEEEEMIEEVWEVFEETIDTPPEILALLAKQNA